MTKNRRKFWATCKAMVAVLACRAENTTIPAVSEPAVRTSEISAWKKPLLERAGGLFDNSRVDDGVTFLRAYCRHRLNHRV